MRRKGKLIATHRINLTINRPSRKAPLLVFVTGVMRLSVLS
jgi:hypothetical protein